MPDAIRRILFALAGGVGACAVVASVEAGVAGAGGGSRGPEYGSLYLADVGVLGPLALLVGFFIACGSLFLEPGRARWVGEHLDEVRSRPLLQRTRSAALAPLAILGSLAWCVIVANVARGAFGQGAAFSVGVTLAAASVAIAGLVAVTVLVLVRPLRRALAFGAKAFPLLVDPVATGAFAGGIAVGVLALGISLGDTGGGGEGALAIFGVLKRGELDLRPVVNLLAITMGAYLAIVAFAGRRAIFPAVAAVLLIAASTFVTLREARALNEDDSVGRALERGAPLGRTALAALRKATDRDHDGASAWFGGGDCDDGDARRSPLAIDVPDNGIDEDCSGADLHLPTKGSHPVEPAVAPSTPTNVENAAPEIVRPRVPSDLNLLVITVDTLRTDVGFMGYPKDTTPNLDRLAEKGVVFDRMYSMASYTGKSVGPLFIGKYPSETKRDGGHFNTYFPANTFLAERLRDAGIHTMGAAPHWYFEPWSGLPQGIENWDLHAMPSEGQGENDTSVTSKELSDVAIRLLKKPENTSKRFFMWLHYFDPHEQYMPHDDAPDFGKGNRGAYDAEIWFTDKHIGRVLDYIASQPWGERTAIVLTADHGEMFSEHGMNQHGLELWESLVRVPFLVYVPGVTPHHVPVKRSHIDFAPTMLDLMSVWRPAEGELSGESMIDDVVGIHEPGGRPYEERDVYMDMPAGPYTQMRHALIHGATPGMKLVHLDSGQFQLFDLAADPDEKEDLAGDKAKLAEMVELFREKRGSLKEIDVKVTMPAP